jgi:hypothetical protein
LVNGIQRIKATSANIDYLRLLFPACQVGRAPPPTARRATQPPHAAMGGAHAAICRPRGGFAKQKLLKN